MKWLGTIIALGMISLLIGSIIEGNRIEQEQAAAEDQQQPVRQYTPNEEAATEKYAAEVTAPTEEMQTKIQEVIPKFLKAYVPFSIESPD